MKIPKIQQYDQTDCGVACLLMILQFYGSNNTIDNLRLMSGTNLRGTTLLGLYQAALDLHFTTQGCQATMQQLIEHNKPCILHTITPQNLEHYIVCWFYDKNQKSFTISDPGFGIKKLSIDELELIWKSKTCLILEPNEKFIKNKTIKKQKLNWIHNLLFKDYSLLIIISCLGLFISILNLTMAVYLQKVIDDFIPNKLYNKLYWGLGLVFFLLIIKECLNAIKQRFGINKGFHFNNRISTYFFENIIQLPKLFFDTRKIGDLVARLNDTSRIQNVISLLSNRFLIDLFIFLTSSIFIFIYSVNVGFVCFIFFPLIIWLIIKNNSIILSNQKQIMANYAVSEANYINTLQSIETIKNFNKQNLFININKNYYFNFQNCIYSLGKIQIKLVWLINIISIFYIISILGYCSYLVSINYFKLGEMIAITTMATSLLPSLISLATISIPLNEAWIAFERMFEFTQLERESKSNNKLSELNEIFSIELNNINFRFVGRSLLFENVNAFFTKGKIYCIIGDNGLGKSSLIQIIQKYYIIESGSILLNGNINLHNVNINNWHKFTGVVNQNSSIINGTVVENIAFEEGQINLKNILLFLEEFGFDVYFKELPNGLFSIVGEEGINLSAGQKQLIYLARVLYHKPSLIILDEATSSMSESMENFVLQLLLKIKEKSIIIIVSHKPQQFLQITDQTFYLYNKQLHNTPQ